VKITNRICDKGLTKVIPVTHSQKWEPLPWSATPQVLYQTSMQHWRGVSAKTAPPCPEPLTSLSESHLPPGSFLTTLTTYAKVMAKFASSVIDMLAGLRRSSKCSLHHPTTTSVLHKCSTMISEWSLNEKVHGSYNILFSLRLYTTHRLLRSV